MTRRGLMAVLLLALTGLMGEVCMAQEYTIELPKGVVDTYTWLYVSTVTGSGVEVRDNVYFEDLNCYGAQKCLVVDYKGLGRVYPDGTIELEKGVTERQFLLAIISSWMRQEKWNQEITRQRIDEILHPPKAKRRKK